MEFLAGFLLFALVAAWLIVKAIHLATGRYRQSRELMRLARAFGGRYRSGSMLSAPEAIIFYGDTKARVRFGRGFDTAREPCLLVSVGWPFATEACELNLPPGLLEPSYQRRAWSTFQVPSEFGRRWEVRAERLEDAQQLLTSGVQWQAERIACAGRSLHLHLLILEGEITAAKEFQALRGDAVAPFVQGVLELYDQCLLAKATGIEFLHTDEAQPLDHVRCNICGDEIVDQMVVCRRCHTPHHEDCWQYAGSCSVFGCRETKYT